MKNKIVGMIFGILLGLSFSVFAFAEPVEETENEVIEGEENAEEDDFEFEDSAVIVETLTEGIIENENEEEFIFDEGNEIQEEIVEQEVEENPDNVIVTEDGVITLNTYELSDRIFYSNDTQRYYYLVNDTEEFATSVMDGMVVTYAVSMEIAKNNSYRIYKDGEPYEIPEDHVLRSFGSYSVMNIHDAVPTNVYSFLIVPAVTNAVHNYQMPKGFRITSALRNGEIMNTTEDFVSLDEEGSYQIFYECPFIERAFSLEVSVDHTAPELLLSEVNEKGFAAKPVSILDHKPEDMIRIRFQDKEIKEPSDGFLRTAGNYEITVTDAAGNSNSYSFVIRPYLNVSAGVAFGILGAILILVIAFVIRVRKFTRVR